MDLTDKDKQYIEFLESTVKIGEKALENLEKDAVDSSIPNASAKDKLNASKIGLIEENISLIRRGRYAVTILEEIEAGILAASVPHIAKHCAAKSINPGFSDFVQGSLANVYIFNISTDFDSINSATGFWGPLEDN